MEDGLPHPYQEGFGGQHSSFLQSRVKDWEFQDCSGRAIFVRNEREDWAHCVNCGIAKDQVSIVNWNGDEVEDDRENCLDHGDDEASVDDELAQDG